MLSTKFRRSAPAGLVQSPTNRSSAPQALLAGGLALLLVACAPGSAQPSGGSGGKSENGGSTGSGGNTGSGGKSENGGSTGSGGKTGNGGSAGSGGKTGSGGSAGSGGKTGSGGSAGSGGSGGSGGTTGSGGSTGSGSGGSTGSGSGGSTGSGTGGSTGSGTGGSTGSAAGGSTGGGSRPPGFFYTADWNVSKVDWHGCVWAGKDCASNCPTGVTPVAGSTTTLTPQDFMSVKNGGPYQISGKVHNSYEAVALLGFNINESPTGSADQCKYDPALKDGPPTVTMPPSGTTGIAVNWSATKLPAGFRIQIQGVKGSTDPNNRWCADIKDTNGPSFVPYTSFNTQCWEGGAGKAYANEPIDAVAFLVTGHTSEVRQFDITVVGFAPGNSKADAPGPAPECGTKTGTVGTSSLLSDATKATDASMERVQVNGKDCKKYILNNNNWGQKSSTYQQLSYVGNSFKVEAMNGTESGQGVPASFPSLYVGANGQIANGADTWEDTGLPKTINEIQSAQSTFKWGGKTSGDFNAAYDIWFAKSKPAAGSYDDGVSGLLMIWLYKPGSRQPIGSVVRQANIGGVDYDVWAGPRGATSKGTDAAGRPVISYVAKSTVTSFSADLKAFFNDAVSKADTANGITQPFSASWYLTDVFGGFEIWSGGSGLSCSEFTVAIK